MRTEEAEQERAEDLAAMTLACRTEGGQEEDGLSALMASLGHPMADEYRLLRAFHDTLTQACGPGARMLTYGHGQEHSTHWAPGLSVGWEPGTRLERRFGPLSPAVMGRWRPYVEAVAKEGWPATRQPRLHPGRWAVATGDQMLARVLEVVADAFPGCAHSRRQGGQGVVVDVTLPPVGANAMNCAIVALLEMRLEDQLLPRREPRVAATTDGAA